MSADFPEHWQLKSIEEAMDALIDYRGKTPKKTTSGIPLITAKIVKNGRIHEPSEFIAEDNYDSWMVRGLPEVGDVVVTTEAPLGEVAQINNSNIALAQRIVTLRGKKGLLNNDFLLYAMQSGFIQHQLESRASGSTVKGIKQSELRKVLVPIPPENEQIEIAKHLKSIDSKIALNRQINQTLEAMAQAIFKSWFVDFDPVKAKIAALESGEDAEGVTRAAMRTISGKTDDELDKMEGGQPEDYARLKTTAELFPVAMQDSELGEVPEGWEVKALGNYLTIKRGGSPRPIKDFIVLSGLPWVKIADATAEPSPFLFKTKESIKPEGLKKTVLLKKGSLILSNSATPGLPKFLELDACIHDGWLHFPKKELFSDVYLYLLFLEMRTKLVAQGNGSVFTNLKTDILRNQVVVAPAKEIINQFDNSFVLIFENMKKNCEEINLLSKLRDTLLPKLLSGEIRMSMAEKIAEKKL